jgi:hypothetical protein
MKPAITDLTADLSAIIPLVRAGVPAEPRVLTNKLQVLSVSAVLCGILPWCTQGSRNVAWHYTQSLSFCRLAHLCAL